MAHGTDTLILVVKKKWFDMILAGVKKEEYRAIKEFWIRRLILNFRSMDGEEYGYFIEDLTERPEDHKATLKESLSELAHFAAVEFRNGYQKNARTVTMEFKGIEIKKPNPEWSEGEFGDDYLFAIKLGEEKSRKNIT